ncbi:MAG: MaoC/PaaZ C-terminal domain-containing protein [Candidatus Sphingomonas phytovorans]|nr:MaoC/PaaZ C-terminal domain-containing protein [Sphingomonas sp.]WEK02220.1 MAG: MaoC/PaaZ C-terminal domain-containing protein [Sphingomonas sp.]
MAINYPGMLDLRDDGRRFAWTDREAMLYAVGIGMGQDPTDPADLAYVFEQPTPLVVPTFAAVISWGAGIKADQLGVDYTRMLHGEEDIVFHRPIPAHGTVTADSGVIAAYDKGEGKGALIVRETVLRDTADGAPLATIHRTAFARADGGFGGPSGPATPPHAMPDRAPDRVLAFETRPEQALLYRLSGDRNPLHADPAVAARAGFARPILHGLCTYGITCRAVLAVAGNDPALIRRHAVRFSSPVLPGETIEVRLWRDDNVVSFEADVPARGVTVIKNGRSELG